MEPLDPTRLHTRIDATTVGHLQLQQKIESGVFASLLDSWKYYEAVGALAVECKPPVIHPYIRMLQRALLNQ